MKLITLPIFCCSILMADATSTFVQTGELPAENYPAGYNAPAQICLDKTWQPNISLDLSFLYYYAGEDGLDLANSAGLQTGIVDTVVVATPNSTGLVQEFQYKPGFKVGLGFEYNEWVSNLEYTWIRQTTTTSETPVAAPAPAQSAVWIINNWFQQTTSVGQTISATDLSSEWHLAMDVADLTMGRPFYQSRNTTVSSFGGIRAAWIRQKLNMTIDVPAAVVASLTSDAVYSHNYSNSWSLGPRGGCESSTLLGGGFKINGNAAIALLFTQYTTVHHSERTASALADPTVLNTTLTDVNCLRPELDLGLGFGWGSYCGDSCYIDLSANYDFSLFWSQNMMRKLVDQINSGTGASPGDLFLQGLSIRGSILF